MKFWLLLLVLCVPTGCGLRYRHHSSGLQTTLTGTAGSPWPDEHGMTLEYKSRNGHAALESARVVLVFHGLTARQQRVFHFQGPQQTVQVAGTGTSSAAVSCRFNRVTVAFRADYAQGTNTLQLGAQTVRFAQEGRLLLAGGQAIDLGSGQKVVHLEGDQARVEP